ncbi:hypothetical protein BGW80DRAFT_721256 [Lactifluus volemus]|nr:hypothetical protein BGW80DRAFT_721256 [Lactifluus volemus]
MRRCVVAKPSWYSSLAISPLCASPRSSIYAMLSKTTVHHFEGMDVALGMAGGKPFRVGVMTITDPGNSDLLTSHYDFCLSLAV